MVSTSFFLSENETQILCIKIRCSLNSKTQVLFHTSYEVIFPFSGSFIETQSVSVLFHSPFKTAEGNITVRSTIKLRSNKTRLWRIKLGLLPYGGCPNCLLFIFGLLSFFYIFLWLQCRREYAVH